MVCRALPWFFFNRIKYDVNSPPFENAPGAKQQHKIIIKTYIGCFRSDHYDISHIYGTAWFGEYGQCDESRTKSVTNTVSTYNLVNAKIFESNSTLMTSC